MGWFRRSAGRHSYGVPVVAARSAVAESQAAGSVALATLPRLSDARTSEEIGSKVAEVLWGYYGQQGVPGTSLTTSAPPEDVSPAYDDAYVDFVVDEPSPSQVNDVPVAQVAERDEILAAEVAVEALIPDVPVAPVVAPAAYADADVVRLLTAPTLEPIFPSALTQLVWRQPVAPPPATPRYRVFERVRRPAETPAVTPSLTPSMHVTAPVRLPAPAAPTPERTEQSADTPADPAPRGHVVQLGFLDGSTLELVDAHPAAKALRAAARALTLRDSSSD